MKRTEFKQKMIDGKHIHIYKWEPEQSDKITGVIQLVHGSCEHAARYEDFARVMTDHGYVVYANDHRGHGLSVDKKDDLGYFGDHGGWRRMVEDLYEITQCIKEVYGDAKIIMLGHSMGSFLVRHYAILYGKEIHGLIITGTAHNPRLMLRTGKFLAERDIQRNGSKHRSKFLNKLSYGAFNDQFEPNRTEHDWITRDAAIVDQFLEDDLCGFILTSSGFRDMFDGLLFITDKENISRMPKSLPVLLLSGKMDPVGQNGKMVMRTWQECKKAGIEDVNLKLYDGMRHEILNEIGKEEVYTDILQWLNYVITK